MSRRPTAKPPATSIRFRRPAPPYAAAALLFLTGLVSGRRLILIIARLLLAYLPESQAYGHGERRGDVPQPAGVGGAVQRRDRAEGIHDLDRDAELVPQHLVQPGDLSASSGNHDRVDLVGARRRLEEVEGLLQLRRRVLGDSPEDRLDRLARLTGDRLPLLESLGLLEVQGERLLEGLGELVAAERDVAPEDRLTLSQDVHVHHRRADVHERDDARRIDAVVDLVTVLKRKGVVVD